MSKRPSLALSALAVAAALVHVACAETEVDPNEATTAEDAIHRVYRGELTAAEAQARHPARLEVVALGGTVFHFGLDLSQSPPVPYDFQATVAGARVWIAEAPITRRLGIRTGADGTWRVLVVKLRGVPLRVSFVYELDGYPTTKSQLFEIGAGGITDLAVQFPTAAYYSAAKGQIEQQIGALIGAPYSLRNVLVTTVGKSWASMYSTELPHGDPGVQVAMSPAAPFPTSLGPVYFNEAVAPDPTLGATSVDGGVMFGNLAAGRYVVTASKAPFSYDALTFDIQDDVPLYVASPPHASQGTNSSPAGQP
jgi:hypothetical protein